MLFIRWKVMHGVILTHGWYCVLFSKILDRNFAFTSRSSTFQLITPPDDLTESVHTIRACHGRNLCLKALGTANSEER